MRNNYAIAQTMTAAALPRCEEAEQDLLGALMVDDKVFDTIPPLRPEWFYMPVHGRIYSVICTLRQQGRGAIPHAVAQYIGHDAELAEVGGAQYIHDLADMVITTVGAADHAQIIQSMHQRRALIFLARHLNDMAVNADVDTPPEKLMAQAEKFIGDATESHAHDTVQIVGSRFQEALKDARAPVSGIKVGLPSLDKRIRGFQKQKVYVMAGRPGMGKSAAALTFAVNAAEAGHKAMFCSLEMGHDELLQRIMSRYSGRAVHSGDVHGEDQWAAVASTAERITKLPLWIEPTAGLTISEIYARARRQKRLNGLDMLIIDHLGLVVPENRNSNKVHQIGEITNMVKRMAKDLDIPVILLCQLSRAVEARDDKRPVLSDLRDSGEIEQDADVVIFLYREEYYTEREKPNTTRMGRDRAGAALADWEEKLERSRGTIDLIVAKLRGGKVGIVHAKADMARQVIYE